MDKFVINRNKPLEAVKKTVTNSIHSQNTNNSTNSKKPKEISVYTDGACIDNGKPYARAGYGIWFGENDKRNTSETYKGNKPNIAELLAIIKALTILDAEVKSNQIIHIYSDSRYAIRCCRRMGKVL